MKMKRLVSIFIALYTVIIGPRTVKGNDPPPYMLVDSRPPNSLNSVTLRCRDLNGQFATQVVYFRNGSDVDTIEGFIDFSEEEGTLVFVMDRSFEGDYSCGTQNQRSDPVRLIAFPDRTFIPPRPPAYAVVGDTAVLQCGIEPGALVEQYYATWLNGTQPIQQYLPPVQRLINPATNPASRYSIDPDNLSLIINDVRLSDALENYRCEIGVEDPRTNLRHVYQTTTNYDIELRVVAPPQIVTDLSPNTVISTNTDVTLSCSAEGLPPPTVSWQHAGRAVTDDSPNFKTNFTISQSTNGGSNITRSYLEIRSANSSRNGEVKCIANPPPPEDIGGLTLNADSTSTQLAALGFFKSLKVQITKSGDVIIIVTLQRALVVPVHLNLVFTDLENPTHEERRVTQAAYLNTTVIQHIVFSSLVTLDHFVVEVGLFANDVYGPLTMAPGEYDKDSPTIFDEIFSTEKLIIIGSVTAAVVLIICIKTGLVHYVIYRRKLRNQQRQGENNHKQDMKKIDVVKEQCDGLRSMLVNCQTDPQVIIECVKSITEMMKALIQTGKETEGTDGGNQEHDKPNGDIQLQPLDDPLTQVLIECVSEIVNETIVQKDNQLLADEVQKNISEAIKERETI